MSKVFYLFVFLNFYTIAFGQAGYVIEHTNNNANPGGLNTDSEYPVASGLSTTWTSISSPNASTPQWSSINAIPFSFDFSGSPVTHYKVSTSGVLTFDTAASIPPSYTKGILPNNGIPDKSVCVWGLAAPGVNDIIVQKTFGSSPNRQHWVLFSSFDVDVYSSCYTYWSIVLEETSNKIYVVDQRNSCTSASFSIGIQVNSSTAYTVAGSPSVQPLASTNFSPVDNHYYEFIPCHWSEDFNQGIPSAWQNNGFTNFGMNDPTQGLFQSALSSPWEYRGVATNPDINTGSRGAYNTAGRNINSETFNNGFVIFDSDYLYTNGVYGSGTNGGIHQANLITENIDLSNANYIDLVFTQFYRRFGGVNREDPYGSGFQTDSTATFVDFSINNGPWFGNIEINNFIGLNYASSSNNKVHLPIGNYVGGNSNVRIRFRFEGGYYFWMLDDISIQNTPDERISFLDNFSVRTDILPAPRFQKGIYINRLDSNQSAGSELLLNETTSYIFKSQFINTGKSSINNPIFNAYLLDSNSNKIGSFSAPANPYGQFFSMAPGDTLTLSSIVPMLISNCFKCQIAFDVTSFNQSYRQIVQDTFLVNSNQNHRNYYFDLLNDPSKRSIIPPAPTISSNYLGNGAKVAIPFKILPGDNLDGFIYHIEGSYVGASATWQVIDSNHFYRNDHYGFPAYYRLYGNINVSDTILAEGSFQITMNDSLSGVKQILDCELKYFAPGTYYLITSLYNDSLHFNPLNSSRAENWPMCIENEYYNIQGLSNKCGFSTASMGFNWFRRRWNNSPQFNSPKVTFKFGQNLASKISLIGDSVFCHSSPVLFLNSDLVNSTWFKVDSQGVDSLISNADSLVINLSTGYYYNKSFDASGCEHISDTVHLRNLTPQAIVSYSGPLSFCDGGSVTLSAPSGGTYLWSTGATSQSITASTSGSYTVTVTNSNGCSATSTATQVSVLSAPTATITASGPLSFCNGGSVTLSAPSGGTYLWSTGATSQSITASTSGSYTVTVTNSNGCSAISNSTVVSVLLVPTISVSYFGSLDVCNGPVTLYAPVGGLSYLWSTGATTTSITVNTPGNYYVSVGLLNGCTATSPSVQVTSGLISATITASGPLSFCDGGSVTLSAPSGGTYLWSTGATSQSITASTSGNYTVTVTNSNGCSATSTATQVSVLSAPTATITASGPLSFCDGGSVTLSAPSGGTYLWSTGATSQSITASTSGSYTVTVTNSNGCSATSTATQVSVLSAPTATITASGPLSFCNGGSVTLSAPSGGSYLWSTGATSQSITASTSGNYTVTVTNSNGCSATSTATQVTSVPNNINPVIYGNTSPNQGTQEFYYTSQNLNRTYNWQVIGGVVISGQGSNTILAYLGSAGSTQVIVTESDLYCQNSDTLIVNVSGIGMDEFPRASQIYVVPNPSTGKFHLATAVGFDEELKQIRMFDMTGRLIFDRQNPTLEEEYFLEQAGVYTVMITTDKAYYSERIIRTK